ncbi:MAG: hypothetical protein MK098_06775 [Marinovum sp.]|nr:hypothetical protein [Marinovum sp.]
MMRRLSPEERIKAAAHARNRWKKELNRRDVLHSRIRLEPTLRRRIAETKRVHLVVPEVFGLNQNYSESMSIVEQLKQEAFAKDGHKRIFRLDFSQVEHVELDAFLVISAEIDRARNAPGIKNLNRFSAFRPRLWRPHVLAYLEQFGFFDDLVEYSLRRTKRRKALDLGFATVPTIACAGMAPERAGQLSDELRNVAQFFRHPTFVYEGLVEAMHNTVDHAYRDKDLLKYSPVIGDWWWAAAIYLHAESQIQVVMFDQGAGIPKTLPRWSKFEAVRGYFDGWGVPLDDDGLMIRAAIQTSRTSRSSSDGRGKGLGQIVSIARELDDSSVRILSGNGQVIYRQEDDVEVSTLEKHIGGTLIEWRIPVHRNGV